MKLWSDNMLMLFLATVLSIAPMQSIAASVSKCMNMDSSMHVHMISVDSVKKMDMTNSGDTADCCNQNDCGTTHCTSVTAAVISSNNITNISYALFVAYKKPNKQLISFYPSSLYRPPKV